MSFVILIPTINRKDLLMEALNHYKEDYPSIDVLVLDNGNQGIEINPFSNYYVIYPPNKQNLGVAKSWNYLIDYAINYRKAQSFLILNDDIVLKTGQGRISQIFETHGKNTFHVPRPFYHWSAFMLTKDIYDKVGGFDEAFQKCFFEDNDYAYRLKLANVQIRYEDDLNAQIFRNSQTIAKDPLLSGYIENKEYYIKKWGGIPNEETYKTPFNQ